MFPNFTEVIFLKVSVVICCAEGRILSLDGLGIFSEQFK